MPTPGRFPMSTSTRESRRQNALLATRSRKLGPDHPLTVEARAEMCTARMIEFIEATVAKAPPLTEAQLARIAAAVNR